MSDIRRIKAKSFSSSLVLLLEYWIQYTCTHVRRIIYGHVAYRLRPNLKHVKSMLSSNYPLGMESTRRADIYCICTTNSLALAPVPQIEP